MIHHDGSSGPKCEAGSRPLTSLAGPQHLSEGCIVLPVLPGREEIPQRRLDLKVDRVPAVAELVSRHTRTMH